MSGLHEFAKKTTAGTGNIASIAGMTGPNITVSTGTAGTDFAVTPNSPSPNNLLFDLPVASSTNTGKLSSTDWTTFNGKMIDPMTTAGDIVIRDLVNTTARLGIGTAGQVLTVVGGVPAWDTPASSMSMQTDPFTGDGVVVAFNLTTPAQNTNVRVFLNGLRQTPTTDYTATTTIVTFTTAPLLGDIILVDYIG